MHTFHPNAHARHYLIQGKQLLVLSAGLCADFGFPPRWPSPQPHLPHSHSFSVYMISHDSTKLQTFGGLVLTLYFPPERGDVGLSSGLKIKFWWRPNNTSGFWQMKLTKRCFVCLWPPGVPFLHLFIHVWSEEAVREGVDEIAKDEPSKWEFLSYRQREKRSQRWLSGGQ